MTAMRAAPLTSSSRSIANKLRAASPGSPRRAEIAHPARRLWAHQARRRATPRLALLRSHPAAAAGAVRSGWRAGRGRAAPPDRRPVANGPSSSLQRRPLEATGPQQILASGPLRSSTVLSTPTGQAPPSRTRSTASPRSAATCRAVVGLTKPDGLALGAATGSSTACQQRPGHGVRGHAHRHRIQAGSGEARQRGALPPEAAPGSAARARTPRRSTGHARRTARGPGPREVGDVDDQGIVRRPALGGIDARHRRVGSRHRHPARRRSRSGTRRARPGAGAVPPRRRHRRPAPGSAPGDHARGRASPASAAAVTRATLTRSPIRKGSTPRLTPLAGPTNVASHATPSSINYNDRREQAEGDRQPMARALRNPAGDRRGSDQPTI